jgi:hypothetical protein
MKERDDGNEMNPCDGNGFISACDGSLPRCDGLLARRQSLCLMAP